VPTDEELPPLPNTHIWVLGPVITRGDIAGLCDQLLVLLHDSDSTVVICDVAAVTAPDAVTVEALARLQLTALRHGRQIRLHRAPTHLWDLLVLTGLRDVVPLHTELRLEPWRQTEQREQPCGVEETIDPSDPAG
jgi:ABC-type transporter Mla MlaB component